MNYKIIKLADIHMGRKGYSAKNYYYNELVPILEHIKGMERISYIEIDGDIGDKLNQMNSELSVYYNKFFSDINEIGHLKGCPIRVLEGTPGHDAGMLDSIKHYEETGYDFKVIQKASWEEVLPGLDVLYLPHESVDEPELYYAELFSRKYDLCGFHGTIEGTAWYLDNQKGYGFHHNRRALTFSLEAIRNVAIVVSGGHIHKRMKLCDNVWYIGALTTLTQDDDKVKGFEIIDYDTDTKSYSVQHIVNPNCRNFKTFIITEILNKLEETGIYNYMKTNLAIENTIIKFQVNRPDLTEKGLINLAYIKSMFSSAHIEVKAKVKEDEQKQIEAEMKMAENILDATTPLEDILFDFIIGNYGENDTPSKEFIREFLGNENTIE
jgi:hypothetical protein